MVALTALEYALHESAFSDAKSPGGRMNMKRCILVSVMLSAAIAVDAKAQSTPPVDKEAVPQSRASGQTQLTVTGCLESADSAGTTATSGGGAADTSRATGAGGGFVLANVKAAMGSKRGGSATAARAEPDTGAAPNLTSFRLEGRDSDLQKYRNSMVEVSGTLVQTKSSGATGTTTAGATGQAGPTGTGAAATGTAPESRNVPTLRVTSLRRVSPTCTNR